MVSLCPNSAEPEDCSSSSLEPNSTTSAELALVDPAGGRGMKAAPSDGRAGGAFGTSTPSALSVLTHDPSDIPVHMSRSLECDVRDIPGLMDTASSVVLHRNVQYERHVRPTRGPHPPPDQCKGCLHLGSGDDQRTVHNSSITRSSIAPLSSIGGIAVRHQPRSLRARPWPREASILALMGTGHAVNSPTRTLHLCVTSQPTTCGVAITAQVLPLHFGLVRR